MKTALAPAAALTVLMAGAAGAQAALELVATGSGATLAIAAGEVDSQAAPDMMGRPAVTIRLAAGPARAFGEMTAANVGSVVEIWVCGAVVSAPRVMEPILGGTAMISGDMTGPEAADLARRIETGDCAGFTAPGG